MELAGVWRRQAITWPDGSKDEHSRCFALVTHDGARGEVCLPEVSPLLDLPSAGDWRQLSDETAAALARNRGAIGTFVVDAGRCTQWRQIDFQPPGRQPEVARLHLHDDILLEDGIHVAYRAVWERVAGPQVPTALWEWRSEHAGPRVLLVLVGDHFVLGRERRAPLPPQRDGLTGLLAEADWAQRKRAIFDCEVSYGEWGPAGGVIRASTFPWREGERLAAADIGPPLEIDGLPPGHWQQAAAKGDNPA